MAEGRNTLHHEIAIWAREGLITRLRDGPRKSRPYGSLFGGVLAQHIASVDPYINGLLTPTSTVCWLLRQLAARYQAGKGKLRFLCPACLTFSSPCRLPSVVSLLDLSRLLGEWGGGEVRSWSVHSRLWHATTVALAPTPASPSYVQSSICGVVSCWPVRPRWCRGGHPGPRRSWQGGGGHVALSSGTSSPLPYCTYSASRAP